MPLILTRYLEFDTSVGDVIDITEKVADAIHDSGLKCGIAVVFVPGATGAVTTIEHEPGLVDDVRAAIERIAPEQNEYATIKSGETVVATPTSGHRLSVPA